MTLSVTYLLLSSGVHFKELSISSFHINKLYIKWDEKLNIHINKLTIFTKQGSSSKDFNAKNIKTYLKSFGISTSFIESIIIEKVNYRDIEASIRYTDNDGGYIRAESKNFNINTLIYKTNNYINFEIVSFKDSIKDIKASGNVVLDLLKHQLLLSLETNIGKDIILDIYTHIDSKKVKYAFVSKKDIYNLEHFISILNPSNTTKYWAYDIIKMKKLTLKKARGVLEFKKPNEHLNNLYLSIDVDKMAYKYHSKIDAIHTKTTNLEFKNGILNIRPTGHTTYNQQLDKSWLKIDFSKKEFILTLYLLHDSFVDKNFLHLLSVYNVKLPFKQNRGKLRTDLTLTINLHNGNVDAVGTFSTKKANFNYLGLNLDIYNSTIHLNNSQVTIEKMFAKYKNHASADITAELDTKNDTGVVNLNIKKASFFENAISLDNHKNKFKVSYNISKNADSIHLSESNWKLFSKEKMHIEALKIPFNYENLFATIPVTQISIEDIATIYASGSTSFKNMSTNLELDLTKFTYNDIILTQSNLPIDFSLTNSKLFISTDDKVKFQIADYDCSINNPKISYLENKIFAKTNSFAIENILNSAIALNYSMQDLNGFLELKDMDIENENSGNILKIDESINFDINNTDGLLKAFNPKFDILATIGLDKWNLSFNALNLINPYSNLLKKYYLDNGELSIFKEDSQNDINFLASFKHKYGLISINNKLTSYYNISGTIDDKTDAININVNNKLNIKYADEISITGKNVGININNTVDFLEEIKDPSDTPNSKTVNFELTDSNIYISDDRRAIADRISLQYYDKIATAQLVHNNATAGFKLQDNVFYLYGENFNDKFMENLFALSKFKDGTFDFSIKGSLKEFDGILYLKDTTVIEYKLLNNMLAFINTIPSLVTFSLPGYNKNGLSIKSSYINFSHKDDQYELKDIYLNSKEMEIIGKGRASYIYNTIDLNLNLKTDLASAISKIPVVGYIIFDKDSISTSLKVSGALDNPDVKTMLAEDIIVAPLNIIKRTLLFPFQIFKSDDEK